MIRILILSFALIMNCAFSEEKSSTIQFPVGELGKSWQFPSDHLPVGGTAGNIHFVMWNILNRAYLHHIVENGQGLKDSLILEKNIPIEGKESLTEREQLVIDQILEMIHHPTHPRALIALQETGEDFFEELKRVLPTNYIAVTTFENDLAHGDLFLFDSDIFSYEGLISGDYKVGNTWMIMDLREIATGKLYRFIQSHVPGGPIKSPPSRKEFADVLFDHYNPEAITLVMGDMNRSPDYFLKNFEDAAKARSAEQPFYTLLPPYPTHVGTTRAAGWIDNIFIANPFENLSVEVSRDGELFFKDLQKTIDLLESYAPFDLEEAWEEALTFSTEF